ncbi:AMP-binding protein [Acidocella sp.]|uniref:AMP-binding protein n=1 Tax=Acidocella sp. TaxID=50710 RepID=UPI00260EDD73|nr:AMP-binding protein [Acidocella sp.]
MIQIQLNPALAEQHRRGGFWHDKTLLDYLDALPPERLDSVAVTDINSMTGQATTLSYRQLMRLSKRIALGLIELGVERGEVVSYQLPNWWEFIALHLACLHIGAVTNPVMPIFRQRELGFMFNLAESRVVVVPQYFRGFDHLEMMREIQPNLPRLTRVFAIGGEGDASFEKFFLDQRREDDPAAEALLRERRMKPDEVMELLYTSGTTGEPKGVLHTSNTHFANLIEIIRRFGLSGNDICYMPSPMAHQTGFLAGMEMAITLGTKLVLQDIWDAEVGLGRIQDENVTFMMGATPFIADLADHPNLAQYDIASLRIFLSAGAPIPRALVERATERLGARIVSAWGMTENLLVTSTKLDDPPEKVFGTDGVPVPGMKIRVVGAEGQVLGPDQEGVLQSQGPSHFVGYHSRPELYDMTEDGWFNTGDLAWIDTDGYVRITGRAKDIIIRGGENVPVVEIEEVLYRHPFIQAAAVVGKPDPRLGERGVAYVVLHAGRNLTMEDLRAHLEQFKMAKQYWPEELIVMDELPRTPSGKIQKFRLRQMAVEAAA